MKNEVFTYEKALDWADLDHVYIAVIQRFSHPDHKTPIDGYIEGPFRTAEEANDAAESAFSAHLTPREQACTHTYAAIVHRCDLRDDLRDWRMDEYDDSVPDWLAIGDTWSFFGAYDSDQQVDK